MDKKELSCQAANDCPYTKCEHRLPHIEKDDCTIADWCKRKVLVACGYIEINQHRRSGGTE